MKLTDVLRLLDTNRIVFLTLVDDNLNEIKPLSWATNFYKDYQVLRVLINDRYGKASYQIYVK